MQGKSIKRYRQPEDFGGRLASMLWDVQAWGSIVSHHSCARAGGLKRCELNDPWVVSCYFALRCNTRLQWSTSTSSLE